MENFGKLEISTKEDLFDNLNKRNLRIFVKNLNSSCLDFFNAKFLKKTKGGIRISLENKYELDLSLVGDFLGVQSLIELSSGKIVFYNPSLLKEYSKDSLGSNINEIKRKEIFSKSYFCYGKENPLE